MSSNDMLRQLHTERLRRLTKIEKEESAFRCSVCLEDKDGTVGTVIPENCCHKICLTCYTNLVISKNVRCPQCRTAFVKSSEMIESTTDDYDVMPPLIPLYAESVYHIDEQIENTNIQIDQSTIPIDQSTIQIDQSNVQIFSPTSAFALSPNELRDLRDLDRLHRIRIIMANFAHINSPQPETH